ncbi:MAG: hypothetical protein JW785_08095 [Acidimicrobiia bacterium]|nr:hypothetical protein [Acidimicrobiia bacterium]
MTGWFGRLPGPTALRVAIAIVLAVGLAALLLLGYEWLGRAFLDSGGTIG